MEEDDEEEECPLIEPKLSEEDTYRL